MQTNRCYLLLSTDCPQQADVDGDILTVASIDELLSGHDEECDIEGSQALCEVRDGLWMGGHRK